MACSDVPVSTPHGMFPCSHVDSPRHVSMFEAQGPCPVVQGEFQCSKLQGPCPVLQGYVLCYNQIVAYDGATVARACCACPLRMPAACTCCVCALRVRVACARCVCLLRVPVACACCMCSDRSRCMRPFHVAAGGGDLSTMSTRQMKAFVRSVLDGTAHPWSITQQTVACSGRI